MNNKSLILTSLNLKNFATFTDQTINFSTGFNSIIGETGSGKSLILDALNFILGQRADKKIIRKGSDFSIIEANFDKIYENKTFEAAAVTPTLAAEIKTAYEELRESKAIKATVIGEDEDLEKAFDAAYEKLTKLLFDPVGGTSSSSWS